MPSAFGDCGRHGGELGECGRRDDCGDERHAGGYSEEASHRLPFYERAGGTGPRNSRAASCRRRAALRGVRQRRRAGGGQGLRIDGRTLVFDRELRTEGKLGFWRWLSSGSGSPAPTARTTRSTSPTAGAGSPSSRRRLPLEPLSISELGARGARVLLEPGQELPELLDLGLGQPRQQPSIERLHRPQQLGVLRSSEVGELDAHGAAVGGISAAYDEPVLLEPVEVAGERGPLDPERTCELVLGPPRFALEFGEDEPHRHRAADLGEGIVECTPDVLRRVSELEPIGVPTACIRGIVALLIAY